MATPKGLFFTGLVRICFASAEKWRKWKRAFEYYAKGKAINNARKKACQLLHFARMEVQDIFEDLEGPGPIHGPSDSAFKIVIHKLDAYFPVKETIPYERHVFRQLAMKEEESAIKDLAS